MIFYFKDELANVSQKAFNLNGEFDLLSHQIYQTCNIKKSWNYLIILKDSSFSLV